MSRKIMEYLIAIRIMDHLCYNIARARVNIIKTLLTTNETVKVMMIIYNLRVCVRHRKILRKTGKKIEIYIHLY